MSQQSTAPAGPAGGRRTAAVSIASIRNASASTTHHKFRLSNPKNYLGGAVAVAAPGATGALIPQHLVRMAGAVKQGCQALGLLTTHGDLSERGRLVARTAREIHGGPAASLRAFHELKGDGTRFIDAMPRWHGVSQAVFAFHPTVRQLRELLSDQDDGLRLPALATIAAERNPTFARDVLLDVEAIQTTTPLDTLAKTEPVDACHAIPALESPDAYRSQTTSQLKSLCYHVGILDQPGSSSDKLDPTRDIWRLDDSRRLIATPGGEC